MDGCECEFSSFFAESESLNEAPLLEATIESAPVCLKRPLRRVRINRAGNVPLHDWGCNIPPPWIGRTVMPTGPPVELAA